MRWRWQGWLPAQSVKIKPPRVSRSLVALECVLHTTIPLSANHLIVLGRIVHAQVSDDIFLDAHEPLLDTNALHLIGGMHGAKWYTRTSDLFAMDRPRWSDWIREGKVKR